MKGRTRTRARTYHENEHGLGLEYDHEYGSEDESERADEDEPDLHPATNIVVVVAYLRDPGRQPSRSLSPMLVIPSDNHRDRCRLCW
jgi:hypothetical protein